MQGLAARVSQPVDAVDLDPTESTLDGAQRSFDS